MGYKNALITGATGFLGSYIKDSLEKQSFKIFTLGRNTNSSFVSNLTDSILNINQFFDMVIHSAGKAHSIPKNEIEKQEFYKVNFIGTQNLCYALENNKPNTFIFISTIAVYGRYKGENIDEKTSLNGKTAYAKSKIKAEVFLQKWCKENKVNLVILRLPLVAGKNPKGNLGSMLNGIKKGYYFNISGNNAKKSIVLAEDIARLIPNLIGKRGTYNLSGNKDYTFKEISNIITDQLGGKTVKNLPNLFVCILAKIGDIIPIFPIDSLKLKKITSNLTVSSEKAKKELKWRPKSLSDNFEII